jgi:hypothetical protein
MMLELRNIIIPRPKGPVKFCGEDDVGYGIQLNRVANLITTTYRVRCDLIVLGRQAYDLVMENEDYQKIAHLVTPAILVDDEFSPMAGYACISGWAKDTVMPLRFIPHHYAETHPYD